ncbi:unnamed protein product [marine sediment metagenome]|uniref:Uncharacterized protein n=1 Tax=marine sediment metagenome TaxID=412755 RepID=X1FNX4_9ZZZZ
MKVKSIEIEKGVNGYEHALRIRFDNNTFWVPTFIEYKKLTKLIFESEDLKYPNGLGSIYPFLKLIYPHIKDYLEANGFKIPEKDLLIISK